MMKANQDEKAVTLRLKQVSQLRRLCLSLGKAGTADPPESDREGHRDQITGKFKPSPHRNPNLRP
jgi:hypothetical protein